MIQGAILVGFIHEVADIDDSIKTVTHDYFLLQICQGSADIRYKPFLPADTAADQNLIRIKEDLYVQDQPG